MSIDSNYRSLWAKELSVRPFIERVSKSKNYEDEDVISRELWIYIRKTHPHHYIIPAGSYLIPAPAKEKCIRNLQEIGIKK